MIPTGEVYNEDCCQTMARLNDGAIDLIVTSPPYFNAKEYSQYDSIKSYMGIMREVFTKCYCVLAESRMCIINISPVLIERQSRTQQSYRIPLPFYFVPMMENIGFEFLEDIIWVKPDGSALNRGGKFSTHRHPVSYKPNIVTEYVLVFKKPAPFLIDKILKDHSLITGEYERTNVWAINPDTNSEHPAPFPELLVERCIRYYSYEGETVYDPFGGSGTTGKVATDMKRNWIVSEINKEYCNMIVRRVNNIFFQCSVY